MVVHCPWAIYSNRIGWNHRINLDWQFYTSPPSGVACHSPGKSENSTHLSFIRNWQDALSLPFPNHAGTQPPPCPERLLGDAMEFYFG